MRDGNDVTYFIGGAETFQAMCDAIKTARKPGHYICLLGWYLDLGLDLTGKDESRSPTAVGHAPYPENSMLRLFERAANDGAQIRVMLWDQPLLTNSAQVDVIDRLGFTNTKGVPVKDRLSVRDVAAILDNRTMPPIQLKLSDEARRYRDAMPATMSYDINRLTVASHHQKVLLVRGELGLIAFCGGVDINEDRVHEVSAGAPQHDVHCRIKGPAAHDLVDVFLHRWKAHPSHVSIDKLKHLTALSDRSAQGRPKKGTHSVRIAQNAILVSEHYDACSIERSIEDVLLAAINKANRFIYIEDQYLGNLRAAEAIKKRLDQLQHVTIIVPHPAIEPVFPWRRKEFLEILGYKNHSTGKQEAKVRAYYKLDRDTHKFGPHSYVHSKTWIFDDELAVIGSANCNNRGWGYDSEVIAAIYDKIESVSDPGFAQQLRTRLWSFHLGVDESKVRHGYAPEVMNLWRNLPRRASVWPYLMDPDFDYRSTTLWTLLDPRNPLSWELVDPINRLERCKEHKFAS